MLPRPLLPTGTGGAGDVAAEGPRNVSRLRAPLEPATGARLITRAPLEPATGAGCGAFDRCSGAFAAAREALAEAHGAVASAREVLVAAREVFTAAHGCEGVSSSVWAGAMRALGRPG